MTVAAPHEKGGSNRLAVGEMAPPIQTHSLANAPITLPCEDRRIVHLQFRRFAGCPICNLHLRKMASRIGELKGAGVRAIAFFHSEAETMRPFQGDLPFEVVADPKKEIYRAFGVETSLMSVLDPRSWLGGLRGMFAKHPSGANTGEGGHLGLPADFLLDSSGRVLAVKYGKHADDQWSVDEVLALLPK